MKLLKTLSLALAFILATASSLLAQTASSDIPPGWKTYLDAVHGFSFAYPPLYKQIRRPGTDDEDANKAAAEGRWIGLRHQRSDARIEFSLANEPFDLNNLGVPPTGQEGPPPAVQEGANTFYYYGAGGGGVEYPDRFFFNLRGKTLSIVFDGPYQGKSPDEATEKIESQMLASFRVFLPQRNQ